MRAVGEEGGIESLRSLLACFGESLAVEKVEKGQLRAVHPLFHQAETGIIKGEGGFRGHGETASAGLPLSILPECIETLSGYSHISRMAVILRGCRFERLFGKERDKDQFLTIGAFPPYGLFHRSRDGPDRLGRLHKENKKKNQWHIRIIPRKQEKSRQPGWYPIDEKRDRW